MKALIDADIFCYEFGSCKDSEGLPLSWPLVLSRINARISGILEAVDADEYQLYLTSEDKSNFRFKIATIKPYKGHRTEEKPYWYPTIRRFLINHRGAQEVYGKEADDAIGIAQMEDYNRSIVLNKGIITFEDGTNEIVRQDIVEPSLCDTVICSRDKDLDMIPGWHYSWGAGKQKEKEMWWQDEIGGQRCFYKQLLTGDRVDNILGLFGIGSSSKYLSVLDDINNELDMYNHVLVHYEKRFGSYAEQFLIENARLLWILRSEDDTWNPPKNN